MRTETGISGSRGKNRDWNARQQRQDASTETGILTSRGKNRLGYQEAEARTKTRISASRGKNRDWNISEQRQEQRSEYGREDLGYAEC